MREVEAFLALADELHFGRAAGRLHRTTPYLSQIIKRLERRVGGALFERTSRRVTLTALGETFLSDVAPAYHTMRRALDTVRCAAHHDATQSVLRVGSTLMIGPTLIDRVTSAFHQRQPDARVIWQTMPLDRYYGWFDPHQPPPPGTDVMLTWVPSIAPEVIAPEQVRVGPVIKRSARVLLMRDDHPLATHASVDVEELAGQRLTVPLAPNAHFNDAWCPARTPSGRPIVRVGVESTEHLLDQVADDTLHITAGEAGWRAVSFPGTVTVPLTGLPDFRLTTLWPATGDTHLARSFAAIAAHCEP
jgi:DNA-binding transcriptional LysR family regulator